MNITLKSEINDRLQCTPDNPRTEKRVNKSPDAKWSHEDAIIGTDNDGFITYHCKTCGVHWGGGSRVQ